MRVEIPAVQVPTAHGNFGMSYTIDLDQVAAVGPVNGWEEYRVTLKDGKEYIVQDFAFPRSQFMAAWKGGQIIGESLPASPASHAKEGGV